MLSFIKKEQIYLFVVLYTLQVSSFALMNYLFFEQFDYNGYLYISVISVLIALVDFYFMVKKGWIVPSLLSSTGFLFIVVFFERFIPVFPAIQSVLYFIYLIAYFFFLKKTSGLSDFRVWLVFTVHFTAFYFVWNSLPSWHPVLVDYGKAKTVRLVVDLDCPHCKEELAKLQGKVNLKLYPVNFLGINAGNLYFLTAKDKKKALKEIVNQIQSSDFIDFSLELLIEQTRDDKSLEKLSEKLKVIKENTLSALGRGINSVPYSF